MTEHINKQSYRQKSKTLHSRCSRPRILTRDNIEDENLYMDCVSSTNQIQSSYSFVGDIEIKNGSKQNLRNDFQLFTIVHLFSGKLFQMKFSSGNFSTLYFTFLRPFYFYRIRKVVFLISQF